MIIVMEQAATEEQIQRVIERLTQCGFDSHRSTGAERTVLGAVGGAKEQVDPRDFELMPGVRNVVRISKPYKLAGRSFKPEGTRITLRDVTLGGDEVVVMAGPCSVESAEQVHTAAERVAAAGAKVLRGGAFKPRTSPYSFQGLGEEGLRLLRKAADANGLLVISEVMDTRHVDLVERYVDIFQVGARNMQNFDLLKELGRRRRPVLLKRGLSATMEEWLLSAEYVMAGGNHQVLLCERGIRTFERYTRNTLDLSAIPVLKKLSHLPVIADPSHGTGIRDQVLPMGRAAVAAGADGLLVEVHPDPDRALCDGAQSLYPDMFETLMAELRIIAPALQRRVAGPPAPASATSGL